MSEVSSLAKLDNANRMLAEIHSVDDAKQLIDLAEAARVYAKQVHLGLEAQNHAAEIKIRAQRRGGEILASMELNKGAAEPGWKTRSSDLTALPTLEELEISKYESSTWQAIASVPDEKFESFIDDTKSELNELTTTAILKVSRQYQARQKYESSEFKDKKYRIIYADPPWKYGDTLLMGYGPAEFHYPTMTIEDLCILPVKDLADDNAVLFIWATSPFLEDVFTIIKAWGFEYKTSFVWDKVGHNFGHYNSVRHEFLLVCTRGSCTPDNLKLFDSVQTIEKSDKHSEKPEEFRNIIDTLYTHGKRIELFSRRKVDGWEAWGNEPTIN